MTVANGNGDKHMASTKTPTRRTKSMDGYMALVRRFPLRPIRTERELDAAIAVINSLIDRDRLTRAEEDYLDVLGDLVKRYEDKTFPHKEVSEAAMLEFLIEARAVTLTEVAQARGIVDSPISEVLSG